MDSMMGLLKALPCENGRFGGKNWFLLLVHTYPKRMMASFVVPTQTLKRVRLLKVMVF
jgi:hypothetical protein